MLTNVQSRIDRSIPLINQTNLHARGRRKTAARVLENRRARKGTVSSNLTPSASNFNELVGV